MESKPAPHWARVVGYPAFFLVCFVFFFHLTLPYDLIKSQAIEAARKQGYALSMVSLGPSLGFGVTAKGVMLSNPPPPGAPANAPAPGPAVLVDSLTARPSLLPLGVHVDARAFGGTVAFQLAGFTSAGPGGTKGEGPMPSRLENLSIKNLDLARAGTKPLLGLELAGTLNAEGEFTKLNDLAKANGNLKLTGKDVALISGTVNYIDLPKINLGALELGVKAETGKAKIEPIKISGGDAEVAGEADVTLAQRVASSGLKGIVQFKPAEDWLKKNSFIQLGLSQAGRPDSKGFYTVLLDGLLGNPRPTLRQ